MKIHFLKINKVKKKNNLNIRVFLDFQIDLRNLKCMRFTYLTHYLEFLSPQKSHNCIT